MIPMKYVKKPVIIEAIQFTETNYNELLNWLNENNAVYEAEFGTLNDISIRPTLILETLEGTMTASPYDYIIKGVDGEFYPCKPDIFKKTYKYVGTEDINKDKEEGSGDNVNHPPHYANGKYEVIDYIKDKLSFEEYVGYCKGNAVKYISRHNKKKAGSEYEDLEKAVVYLNWAIEALKNK